MEYKTIKIIDLLNKKANGEELPKIIIYDSYIYRLEYDDYFCDKKNEWLFEDNAFTTEFLNEKIEILEEEKQETKPITKKDFETLGYACGEIQKAFTNGWTKSLENKPLEDEKKIPGKMPYKCSIGDANPREQFFVDNINTLRDKINGILDYLESEKN